jgi:HAD superfamily hydrolase (TIGR01450 family)
VTNPIFDEPIGRARGVMFDLDGTLILSNKNLGDYKVLPGAVTVLETLRERGIPYLALTNGSAYPAHVQAPRLRSIGLPIPDENLFTPNSVASHVFKRHGASLVMVLGTQGVADALNGDGIDTCFPGEPGADEADAVYVAWHPECTMPDIHAACEAVLNGAHFFTASDVPFFASQHGRSFGYSCAISGAIARVTGKEPEVTGKPSIHAMQFVAAQLGVMMEEVAVIGDDPRVETEMARLGGAIGIGVTTGTTSLEQWAATPPETRPHRVIDRIDAILEMDLLA